MTNQRGARECQGLVEHDESRIAVGGQHDRAYLSRLLRRRSAGTVVASVLAAMVATMATLSPASAALMGPWSYTSPLQVARAGHGMAGRESTLYVVGGHDAGSGAISSTEYAVAADDGTLSAWRFGTLLNTAGTLTTAVTIGGYLYAIGGARHWSLIGQELRSVEFAAIQPDGSLGPWQFTSALTGPRANAMAVAHGEFIYVVGGYGGGQLDSVEHAPVLADGTLGPWTVISRMSRARERPATAISASTLVVLGGYSYGSTHRGYDRNGSHPWRWDTWGLDAGFSHVRPTLSPECCQLRESRGGA
jgi:hypothetical protein